MATERWQETYDQWKLATPPEHEGEDEPEYVDRRPPAVMVYVGGSKTSFHCECGANCFHHPEDDPQAFECNGCGAWYRGEQ